MCVVLGVKTVICNSSRGHSVYAQFLLYAAQVQARVVPTAPANAPPATSTTPTGTCSAGYVPAVIGGVSKCLRRGEYCAIGEAQQYSQYGYQCVDVNGTYRLEPA